MFETKSFSFDSRKKNSCQASPFSSLAAGESPSPLPSTVALSATPQGSSVDQEHVHFASVHFYTIYFLVPLLINRRYFSSPFRYEWTLRPYRLCTCMTPTLYKVMRTSSKAACWTGYCAGLNADMSCGSSGIRPDAKYDPWVGRQHSICPHRVCTQWCFVSLLGRERMPLPPLLKIDCCPGSHLVPIDDNDSVRVLCHVVDAALPLRPPRRV